MRHPALQSGRTAIITGGGAGIGLAVAERLAAGGLNVCIADMGAEKLASASARLAEAAPSGPDRILAIEADVRDPLAVAALQTAATVRFGGTDVLVCNAGIQPGSDVFGPAENWAAVLETNLFGVIHMVQTFVPAMIARGEPGIIVATGSKQGITTPPGDPAFNVAKAGVKVFTEALAHELRNTEGARLSAHLLVPGFVFTDLTRGDREAKPDGAWTAEETAAFFLARLDAGEFYILCPDNNVPRWLDERRILWAAGDIVENRPALSRWHPDYTAAFEAFVRGT
jgi:NAD(P)-dependent dehydrogenase (short-subunit alcohol dehydrogenase family)